PGAGEWRDIARDELNARRVAGFRVSIMKRDPGQISLVLADDHPFLLEGIARVLEAESDLCVVAKCRDGVEGLDAIRQLKPNIAVLDIAMPRLTGLQVLQVVNNEQLTTR